MTKKFWAYGKIYKRARKKETLPCPKNCCFIRQIQPEYKYMKVLMPLANGFEEIEALTVVDIFRRAGIEITMAATMEGPVRGRNNITVLPDALLNNVIDNNFDMIVVPGGPGTDELVQNSALIAKIREMNSAGSYIAAICAAPRVLKTAGIITGKTITSYPSTRPELDSANYVEDRVAVDDKMITSRGAGTSLEFALKLVEELLGKAKADQIAKSIVA